MRVRVRGRVRGRGQGQGQGRVRRACGRDARLGGGAGGSRSEVPRIPRSSAWRAPCEGQTRGLPFGHDVARLGRIERLLHLGRLHCPRRRGQTGAHRRRARGDRGADVCARTHCHEARSRARRVERRRARRRRARLRLQGPRLGPPRPHAGRPVLPKGERAGARSRTRAGARPRRPRRRNHLAIESPLRPREEAQLVRRARRPGVLADRSRHPNSRAPRAQRGGVRHRRLLRGRRRLPPRELRGGWRSSREAE